MTEPKELTVIERLASMYLNGDDAVVSTRIFINTCCYIDPVVASAGADLYKAYQHWAALMGAPTCTERAFLLALGRDSLPKTMRNGRRVWLGLRVKPEYVPSGSAAFVASVGRTDWADDIFAKVERWIEERCDTTTNDGSWSDGLYIDFTKWNDGERVGRAGFGVALGKYPGLYRHDRQAKEINGEIMYRTLWNGIKVVGSGAAKVAKSAYEAPVAAPVDAWRSLPYEQMTQDQQAIMLSEDGVQTAEAVAPAPKPPRPAWMDLAPHQMTPEQRDIWRREMAISG